MKISGALTHSNLQSGLASDSNCTHLECHRGKCEIDPRTKSAHCVCDNPLFTGEFCDRYSCSGYCLNDGMCFPHWQSGLAGRNNPPSLWCSCAKNFTGTR